jgi:phosphoserine phosphatase
MLPATAPAVLTPRFRTVVFDCDSTLSAIEGIDELAVGQRDAITALTEAAMRGEVALEAVYGARLRMIRPGREAMAALAHQYIAAAVPGARETVAALQGAGVEVRILSGGIRQAILPFAEWLGLTPGDVAAVDVSFHEDGAYAGFDEASPLTRSGGKHTLLAAWRERLPTPIAMVGDGITDLEARTAAELFIAYAGVVDREVVTRAADVVVRGSLVGVLEVVLSPES